MVYWRAMNDYKIHTIDLNFKGAPNGIAAFVVETGQSPILVETGPHSTLPTLTKALQDLGYRQEDIRHVFISHIHLDHAGAAWCFGESGANIYLHPRGYKHMHDPSRLLASAKMIYKEEMDALWGTLKPISSEQLVVAEHLESIEVEGLNFIAHHTPGHAQHHIAWQLDSNVFTGDVAGVCINNGPVIPPCPPPDINREDWLASIDHLLSLKDIERYYLTHFGPVSDTVEHMHKLKAALSAYVSFAEPRYKAGKSVDEALPEFRSFVTNFLVEHGLSQEDAAAYEAANPSDMSLTGLMRYWKKRSEVR